MNFQQDQKGERTDFKRPGQVVRKGQRGKFSRCGLMKSHFDESSKHKNGAPNRIEGRERTSFRYETFSLKAIRSQITGSPVSKKVVE